jgi:hypothetical protein
MLAVYNPCRVHSAPLDGDARVIRNAFGLRLRIN